MAQPSNSQVGVFVSAMRSHDYITGLTHDFYRYPARFPPAFARAAIQLFTEPGELVLDPFVGGGTSLVEARVLGRPAVGVDLSPLSKFVSIVKTTPLDVRDVDSVRRWKQQVRHRLHLGRPRPAVNRWVGNGSHRNITDRQTWPITKTIELALDSLRLIREPKVRRFLRCAILRTGQWALDGRDKIPPAPKFRGALERHLDSMVDGIRKYSSTARRADRGAPSVGYRRTLVLTEDSGQISRLNCWQSRPPPKLVLTSPPYPGIHVLYNRWQVLGRRETPAPFWIAGQPNGHAASAFTFGDRRVHAEAGYFSEISRIFASIAELLDDYSIVAQLVAFSHPSKQLPRYLDAMFEAGFREVYLAGCNGMRRWRDVPNRRWYADQWGLNGSRKEVVLLHKLA